MRVELDLVQGLRPVDLAGDDVAVVFDVLRMTTMATALLAAGLRRLWVVAGVEDARSAAAARGALLFGERDGVALPGFDGGNSPLEVRSERVAGRDAVLCTSNGSRAVEGCGSVRVLLGGVVNAGAVARRLRDLAPPRVRLVCAGTDGHVSCDDAAGAACVVRSLTSSVAGLACDDAAHLVLQALTGAGSAAALVGRAGHASTLVRLGFGDDVAFAARDDAFDVVPERGPGGGSPFGAAPAAHEPG